MKEDRIMPRQPTKRTHRLPRRSQRPLILWRETDAGRSALTERVEKGRVNHDRSRKTMVEKLGFDPDLGWVW